MPSDFIWSKNADVVVNERRRKAGEKSEIMITVLTWFTDRFLWSPGSVTEAIPSFRLLSPNVFLSALLHLHFTGARILWLMAVFNWADEEITEMNWIQVDQDSDRWLFIYFFFQGDDGSKSSNMLFSAVGDLGI